MKIIQVVTQMESGGAQRVAMLLAEALRSRGHNSEVWFLYLKRPTYINHPGVRVLLQHPPSPLDYLKIASQLPHQLHTHKPDIVITHTHYANILGQIAAKVCGIPQRIAVQHNPLSTYPKLACLADWGLGSLAFYSTNIAVAQCVVDSAIQYPDAYKKRLTKIYNGVPPLNIEDIPKTDRADWHLPKSAPLLLNVGRLAHQKNQALLLEALIHLPKAHLLLVGEGELQTSLHKRVAELQLDKRVHFLGELNAGDVQALLAICDVFVFPSWFEAMPMAVIEAMVSGIPIIASDIPALREVLGEAGIFVPPASAKELATAIQAVLDSATLANHLRQRLSERARVFSLQKMVDSYEALFR